MHWLPSVKGVRSTDGMLVNMVTSCLVLGIKAPWVQDLTWRSECVMCNAECRWYILLVTFTVRNPGEAGSGISSVPECWCGCCWRELDY